MGAAGSGKSSLAAALAKALCCRQNDTDDVYWLPSVPPFECKRDRDDQFRLLTDLLRRKGRQIVSGSFSGWGDRIVPFVDAVVWVIAPLSVRLERLREREAELYGRAMLPGGPLHERHERFLRWAASYDDGFQLGRCYARDASWFEDLPCPALKTDGTKPLRRQVRELLGWLQSLEPKCSR
jgi:adenylate kinase family enzyme